MFSSAGAKEVSTSPLRINGHDILSVEFGGFSSDTRLDGQPIERDDELGGDLRIMGIDARDHKMGVIDGYLIALVLSDSMVKVTAPRCRVMIVVVLVRSNNESTQSLGIRKILYLLSAELQIYS